MSSQTDGVQPPRIAVVLVTLFAPRGSAESILGDLLEEFSHLASEKGVVRARRWYWRQAATSAAHLIGAEFRAAPWTIAALVTGAFLLRWLVSRLSNPAVNEAINAVLERYWVSENDPQAYLFLFTSSMLIVRLIVNILTGLLVAAMAKGREIAVTITLGLVGFVLAVQAAVLTIAQTGDFGILWTLPHTFAFSIAIVIAGVAVRTRRSIPLHTAL